MNGGVAFAKGGNIYSDGTEIPSDMYTILKEKSAYDKNVDELSEKINKLAKENPSDLGAGLVSDELRNSKKWIDLKRDYNKAVENKKKFLSSEDGKKYMNYYKKLDRMKRMELLKIA